MVYLYALIGAPPQDWPRRPGRPLIVECGSVWAAVEEVAAVPPLTEHALRRHDAVVRELATITNAVAPARFGTVVSNRAALVDIVSKRAEETASVLSLVEGRTQMTVRVSSPQLLGGGSEVETTKRRAVSARSSEDPPGRDTPRAGAVDTPGPGTRYLRARARRETMLQRELDVVHAALGDLVLDERVARYATGPLLASVYHLVAPTDTARYVEALTTRAAGRVSIGGPAPCYAFADGLRL